MDYVSNEVRSYLTYYIVGDILRFYDNPRLDAIYGSDYPVIAIGEDIVRNFKFAILICSNGPDTHPCCYVTFPDDKGLMDEWSELDYPPVDVHGGFTFHGVHPFLNNQVFGCNAEWIGWDYSHHGDYNSSMASTFRTVSPGHKWTTSEVLYQVFKLYRDLIKQNII